MSISVYSGKAATSKEVAVGMKRLKVAFPKMGNEFFNLLSERVVDNGFSSDRLNHAINYVLDNFQYKELNVADIIRYDRKARAYTYAEACEMVTRGEATFDDFKVIEDGGQVYRVLKIDLINKNR